MLENKPKIGQQVEVIVDFSDSVRTALVWKPTSITLVGKVIASEDYDANQTFRIEVKNHSIPHPIIPMLRVIGFKVIGSEINQATLDTSIQQEKDAVAFLSAMEKRSDPDAPIPISATEYKVTGSKGDLYTVSKIGGKWKCSCVAGLYGRKCWHSSKVQALVS